MDPLVDVRALLRAHGLHSEADILCDELKAHTRWQHANGKNQTQFTRLEQLQWRCEVYDACFAVMQQLTTQYLPTGVQDVLQALWSRQGDATHDLGVLYKQQQQQLQLLGDEHQQLQQEHQVLRSNLRSLKLTMQQLLGDVSTLLQHTRHHHHQQHHQQQHQEQHQEQLLPLLPQHPLLASTAEAAAAETATAATASHRHESRARRCVSADGGPSAPPAAAAGSGAAQAQAGPADVTMQRLIAAINRMSRHFADCQAGKLIEGQHSSSYRAAADATCTEGSSLGPGHSTDPAAAAGAAAAAGKDTTSDSSSRPVGGVQVLSMQHIASRTAQLRYAHTPDDGWPGMPNSSNGGGSGNSSRSCSGGGSSDGGSRSSGGGGGGRPMIAPSKIPRAPRLPSSSSSGGGSSGRHQLKLPGPPVLGGVAAAASAEAAIAAAIAHAMSAPAATESSRNGADRKRGLWAGQLDSQPKGQQSQQGLRSSGDVPVLPPVPRKLPAAGVGGLRESFDKRQARAAALAWFRATERASVDLSDSAAAAGTAAAGGGSGGSDATAAAAAAESTQEQPQHGDTQAGLSAKAAEELAADKAGCEEVVLDQQASQHSSCGPEPASSSSSGETLRGSSGSTQLVFEPSSGSLGPCASEVWQRQQQKQQRQQKQEQKQQLQQWQQAQCIAVTTDTEVAEVCQGTAADYDLASPAAAAANAAATTSREPGATESAAPRVNSSRQPHSTAQRISRIPAFADAASAPSQPQALSSSRRMPPSAAGSLLRTSATWARSQRVRDPDGHTLKQRPHSCDVIGPGTCAQQPPGLIGLAGAAPRDGRGSASGPLTAALRSSLTGRLTGGSEDRSKSSSSGCSNARLRASAEGLPAHRAQSKGQRQPELRPVHDNSSSSRASRPVTNLNELDNRCCSPGKAREQQQAPAPGAATGNTPAQQDPAGHNRRVAGAAGCVEGVAGGSAPEAALHSSMCSDAVLQASFSSAATCSAANSPAPQQDPVGLYSPAHAGGVFGEAQQAGAAAAATAAGARRPAARSLALSQPSQVQPRPLQRAPNHSSCAAAASARDRDDLGSTGRAVGAAAAAAASGQQQRTLPSAGTPDAAAGAPAAETATGLAGCVLDLPDLLAIVLDVMNDKQAADKRYLAAGLCPPTLGRHLQSYVAAKVHSNQVAYACAMSALLKGLEQHKEVQPEVAVFCKVLSDDLDEAYFYHTHLQLRQQLQHLATQAALSDTSLQQPAQQQQQVQTQRETWLQQRLRQQQRRQQSCSWEECCSMLLHRQALQALLGSWARQRGQLLQALHGQGAGQQAGSATQQEVAGLVRCWEQEIRQHCGCGPTEAVHAGSAVAALLLWELRQQLQFMRPLAAAFRAADDSRQGLMGRRQFAVFCRHINPAISDKQVQVLFSRQLNGRQQECLGFSDACRVVLSCGSK